MTERPEDTSQLVESGEYFERARAWYRAIYVAPISERSFFMVIAGAAAAVALVGFVGMTMLLPLTDRPAVLLSSADVDNDLPRLEKLRPSGSATHEALMRFFVGRYVLARESYAAADYAANYNFIHAQSDAPTFDRYAAIYDKSNPESPAARLGESAARAVTINSIVIDESKDPAIANVSFTTEIVGRDLPSRTNWTATLQFVFTDLVLVESVDPKTGKKTQTTEDPQFKVVDYVLTKAL